MKLNSRTIGIIGLGNMGLAIAENIVKRGHKVRAFDIDESKGEGERKIIFTGSLRSLMGSVEIVIIAVKPQDFASLLSRLKDISFSEEILVVTIAAGISTIAIEKALLPRKMKIVRVMPNLFLKHGFGTCAINKGTYAKQEHLSAIKDIFGSMGQVMIVDEDKMDAVTAISGSGPGYLSYLCQKNNISPANVKNYMEKISSDYTAAARSLNLNENEADFFAATTVDGLILYFKTASESFSDFQKKVTSPGGTTEAAIKALAGGKTLKEAVQAAADRSRQLSRLGQMNN
jgi:pyrroline-5-carboxylate reductase